MVQDGRGGKLVDAIKIIVLNVIASVEAAAGEKGVLDAGGQQITVADFQVEIVQPFQKAALRIIGQIAQMVPVDLPNSGCGYVHKLLNNAAFLRMPIAPFQRGHDGVMMFLPQLPQIRNTRPTDRARVGHIKDIFQMGSASVFLNQGNALRLWFDPSVHGFVPQLHAGAGGSVGPLGMNQELIVKGILIEAGGRVQILLPGMAVPRHVLSSLTGQLRNVLIFARHDKPPYRIENSHYRSWPRAFAGLLLDGSDAPAFNCSRMDGGFS